MKTRVLSVFGTRPEAIKMAPVVLALKNHPGIDSQVCVTAQHRGMLDQVLELFRISPEYDLDIMKPDQDLFDVTSNCLNGLKHALRSARPDLVLVHGDTTTCMTAALAAFYLQIPVGHVEAGLRTHDMYAPFPEELNRSIVGKLASHHFAPTASARANLLGEGVREQAIHVTGNTVIDALLDVASRLDGVDPAIWSPQLPQPVIDGIVNRPSRFILITGHRRENFGQGFKDFCGALRDIAEQHPEWLLVYPVHLNPNVQKPVNELLGEVSNIRLIAPQDYLPFVWMLKHCDLVITDSGGIQEEAPSLGKPVIVTREVTERPEAVDAGTVRLVGTDRRKIVASTLEILNTESVYQAMSSAHNPYGDGKAAERIVNVIAGGE